MAVVMCYYVKTAWGCGFGAVGGCAEGGATPMFSARAGTIQQGFGTKSVQMGVFYLYQRNDGDSL